MKTNIRYVLLCALQDRLFYGVLALLVAITLIAQTLGNTAFIEQTDMAMIFTASSARLVLVITAIVFVCFYIKSSFDHKHMDVMLSRPISRDHIVLSHWLGFAVISVLMTLPVTIMLWLLSPVHMLGLLAWTVSMVLELWVVVAFALFASFIMNSAVVSVLASLAFYVLSRMGILFVMTAERGGRGDFAWLSDVLETISVVMPRLDLFSKSEWLIRGVDGSSHSPSFDLVILQACIYVLLLLVMCIIDFRKKQF